MRGRGEHRALRAAVAAGRLRATRQALVAVVAGLLVTAAPAAASSLHRFTLTMRELAFQPSALYLKAGARVELVIENRGAAEHEWSAGRGLVNAWYEKGFRTDLLAILKPKVGGQGYHLEELTTTNLDTAEGVEGETVRQLNQEVDVQPGGHVVLDFTVPRSAKGSWRMGCFLPGQYESGMYGDIVID